MSERIPAALVAIVAVVGLVMLFSNSSLTGGAFAASPSGSSYIIEGTTWNAGTDEGILAANYCAGAGTEWTECCARQCSGFVDDQFAHSCYNVCEDMWEFYEPPHYYR